MRPPRLTRQPPVPDLAGRLCLITGAGSGIGRATAIAAADAGARLVLTDVNASALEDVVSHLGGSVVAHRAFDITSHDAVSAFADEVHGTHGSLDVVMNIAGIATWGAVEHLTHEHWRRTIDVNLMGPIHVIESFVPEMVRAGRGGQIVNVSSAAGLMGLPWHAPYSASKFGLRGLSEVLHFDLRRHRIGVTLVCPGAVDTPLVGTVQIAGIDALSSRLTKQFRSHARSPESVATKILRGVTRNRYLVFTSPDIAVGHWFQRHVPIAYELAMRVINRGFVAVLERR